MNTPYILASWSIVFGVLALYGLATVLRGRQLARRVPASERRWVDSQDVGGGGDG